MARRIRSARRALVVMLVLSMLVPVAGPAAAGDQHQPRVRTITDGLVGPLGLAVGRHGKVYVAEAFAGQVTKVSRRGAKRVVYRREGVNVLGGIDVTRRGSVVFTLSKGTAETAPPNRAYLGKLRHRNKVKLLAALSRYEQRRNPDAGNTYGFTDLPEGCSLPADAPIPQPQPHPGAVDSNPYAVTAHHGAYLVADAAGNSILRVTTRGHRTRIRTVAVLPPVPQTVPADIAAEFGLPECVAGATYMSEPVPTDVEVGSDGQYYVSSLPGAPELPGTGSVFKVDPWSGRVRKVAGGLSGAVDLAVDAHGKVYVAELFGNRISVIRHRRVRTFVEAPTPGAVEVDRRGVVYATTNVFNQDQTPGNGTVVRITRRHRRHH